jgi:hypothetical protein
MNATTITVSPFSPDLQLFKTSFTAICYVASVAVSPTKMSCVLITLVIAPITRWHAANSPTQQIQFAIQKVNLITAQLMSSLELAHLNRTSLIPPSRLSKSVTTGPFTQLRTEPGAPSWSSTWVTSPALTLSSIGSLPWLFTTHSRTIVT